MTASPIITGGLGSFAGVRYLVTMGFGIGEAIADTENHAGAPALSRTTSRYPRRYIIGDETYIVQNRAEEHDLLESIELSIANKRLEPPKARQAAKIKKQAKRILKAAEKPLTVMPALPLAEVIALPSAFLAPVEAYDPNQITEEDEMLILMMMAA